MGDHSREPVEVLILAGGQSRRMGVDKASLVVDGTPLIARVVTAVQHLGPIRIVGGSEALVPLVRQHCVLPHELSHVADVVVDPGPFAALTHGLECTAAEEVLVVSCDLAHLEPSQVDRLVGSRRESDADFAVPLVSGRRQWHAIALSKRIIPSLLDASTAGVRSLHRGFGGYRACAVVSSDRTLFSDVDTPDDVERAFGG